MFAILIFGRATDAAVYYVNSRDGSDSNSGNSASRAWRTLGPVNHTRLSPGDSVLLVKGGDWKEILTVPGGGTVDKPVVVGAYGEGKAPVIDGENTRPYAVRIEGSSHIVLRDLQLQNATSAVINIRDCEGCTIEHNIVKNSARFGITAGATRGLTIAGNEYSVDAGMRMAGSAILVNSSVETSLTISDNRIDLRNASQDLHPPAIIVQDVINPSIHGNVISGSSQGIGIKALTRNVTGAQVFDNSVTGVTRMTGGDGESIEFTGTGHCDPQSCTTQLTVSGSIFRNYVQGVPGSTNGVGAVFGTDSFVYRNIVVGPFAGAAFHWSSMCTNVAFYNNTVYGADLGFAVYSGSLATIKNNIVYGSTRYVISAQRSPHPSSVNEDYNLFFPEAQLGAPEQIVRGGHSVVADPQFQKVPPTTGQDLRIRPTSPAGRSGVRLGPPYDLGLDPGASTFPYPAIEVHTPHLGAFSPNQAR